MFSSKGVNSNPRLHRPNFRNDQLGYCLGLRQWQKVGEVTARNPGKGQVLAVGWCLELRYDSRDFVEIRQVGEVRRLPIESPTPCAVSGMRPISSKISDRWVRPPCMQWSTVISSTSKRLRFAWVHSAIAERYPMPIAGRSVSFDCTIDMRENEPWFDIPSYWPTG